MGKVERLAKKLKNYLATDENILYVADTSPFKDAVYPPQLIVTTQRLIFRIPKAIGQQLEDYPYESIVNLQIDEGLMFSNIIIKAPGVERLVEGLSKKEAQEVMKYAREAQKSQ
ncbi:PH domain-containing protein [Candidatus Borrarchaeum sp.]|uniref:PH domain-containing protein n=1 Tax=Candidatus Borrarchaeum sp. TaxID=2846742 RepID=UPI00257BB122|nr:PH domain-containing protein [Candidatus Borrarchaeum sp.]